MMINKNYRVLAAVVLSVVGIIGCVGITGCSEQQEITAQADTAQSSIENETIGIEQNDSTEQMVTEQDKNTEQDASYDFTIAFAGDINFDENWSTMQFYNQQENGIYDCISQELIDEMNRADLMWINNEFTYSSNGTPMDGKAYTFRADPSRVSILTQLGVDVAGLANNHVYDYGKTAFLDTLDTLTGEGIAYVGAGSNLTEAATPLYMEVQGKTVAFVAASRAEKNRMTPQATDTEPGILLCYDTQLILDEIREARQHADFVIACVHWGTEYSTTLEEAQLTTGKEYIDAGADAVIGAHSHCLQGFEFYNEELIAYSLGNFWFNEKTLDTMLLELHIRGDEDESTIAVSMMPAIQSNHQTTYADTAEEQMRIYDYLTGISVNAQIDQEGNITSK